MLEQKEAQGQFIFGQSQLPRTVWQSTIPMSQKDNGVRKETDIILCQIHVNA